MDDFCLKCETPLSDIADQCPNCGTPITYCNNPACGMALNPEVEFCPFCGDRNLEFVGSPADSAVDAAGAEPVETAPMDAGTAAPDDAACEAPREGGGDIAADVSSLLSSVLAERPQGTSHPEPEAGATAGDGVALVPFPGAVASGFVKNSGAAPGGPVSELAGMSGLLDGDLPQLAPGAGAADVVEGMPPAGACPFALDFDNGQRFEVGSKGLVRLRVRAAGVGVRGRVQVTLAASPEFSLQTADALTAVLSGGSATCELAPVACAPRAAGAEAVEVVAEALDRDGLPMGRWRTVVTLRVERPDNRPDINIHANGDIIDLGGSGGGFAEMLGLHRQTPEGALAAGRWCILPLQPDQAFNERLRRVVGRWPPSAPGMPAQPPTETRAPAWLTARRGREELRVRLAYEILCGRPASAGPGFGGGRFDVAADSDDATDTRRISGSHLRVRIDRGRAWCMDVSSNGTWLNGERIARNRWCILAWGDVLALRQVAHLEVTIQGDAQGVWAVCLTQHKHDGSAVTSALVARALLWPRSGARQLLQPEAEPRGTWLVPDAEGHTWTLRSQDAADVVAVPDKGEKTELDGWTWTCPVTD